MIKKTLAILAGGKSSRMNYNNKAFLLYKDKTFIENIILAGEDYSEIIIIANDKELYKDLPFRVIEDEYKDNGPLGGIYVALKNAKYSYVLCIACDMPTISKEVLNYLGNLLEDYEILIPIVEGKLQPLCGIYKKELSDSIEKKLIEGERKLQIVIKDFKYKIVEENGKGKFLENDFLNINTKEELKGLEK